MNVLFLDIDGVVNTNMIYKQCPSHLVGKNYIEKEGYIFDICNPSDKRVSNLQAVIWLDYICHYYGFKIVISSTWRLGHYQETIEALYNSGLSDDIEIIGATPSSSTFNRGEEISIYLKEHPEIKEYIIIDDDIFDLNSHISHVVKTNTYTGINLDTFIKISYIMDGE